MISRSNSAVSDRTCRSNSSSTVNQRGKSLLTSNLADAETVHIHALIAAHRAMDRSRGIHSQPLGRSESTASHNSNFKSRLPQHRRCSPASELRRQRSILQTKAPSLAGSLPFEGQNAYDDMQIQTTYLPPFSEFGENYDAEPSSYRKLRKARSMLAPDHNGRHSSSDGTRTPFSQARTLRHAASNIGIGSTNMGVRLRRSLNFLPTPSRIVSSSSKSKSEISPHPEAIRLAREQFLQNLDQSPNHEQPPLVFQSQKAKKQRALRKSMKLPLEEKADEDLDSERSETEGVHTKKLRSISASLGKRFKKAFRKSKSQEVSLPPQQLESSRPHFGESSMCQSIGFDSYNEECLDHAARNSLFNSFSDGGSNTTDIEKLWQTIHQNGSHDSVVSNTRSRVTSWTDSSVTGSLQGNCGERKRLSVIKEDGSPHQPSSSAGRHFGGVVMIQQPPQGSSRHGTTSKRLYSALIKHMNREPSNPASTESKTIGHSKLERDAEDGKNFEISTIRPVSSQSTIKSVAPDLEHQNLNVNKSPWINASGITPEQISGNLNRRKQKLKAQEAQSRFFPYSTEDISEVASPYRKMMLVRRSGEEATFNAAERSSRSLEEIGSCDNGLPDKKRTLSSESIYSRTTHGGINPQYERPVFSTEDLPLNFEENVLDTGFATIMPTRSCTQIIPGEPDHAKISSPTNAEKNVWKGWVEDQLSSLRRSSSKASRHFREKAQISPGQNSNTFHETSSNESTDCRVPLNKSESKVNRNMRTPTPHSEIPEQLAVPKRRFPLLDVKEVASRNTPAPSKANGVSHGQIGLLKTSLEKHSEVTNENDQGVTGRLSVSLRKISPTNVARFLRGRKSSVSTALKYEADKENKCKVKAKTPTRDQPVHLDLQTWSGNARTKMYNFENGNDMIDESPSDRIKATLSARLSRPFDMETPESNRPFDSMYLGKREIGHCDYMGNRLSVANGAIQENCLGGYGGLGTPTLHRQVPEDETTALPHFPTPEDEQKLSGFRIGLALGSKRMVSNFLRSRRSTLTRNSDGRGESKKHDRTEEK